MPTLIGWLCDWRQMVAIHGAKVMMARKCCCKSPVSPHVFPFLCQNVTVKSCASRRARELATALWEKASLDVVFGRRNIELQAYW